MFLDSTVVDSGASGVSVDDSLCEPTPSVVGSPNSVVSPGLTESGEMAASRANQLVAELEAIFFQSDELVEDVATENEINVSELILCLAEGIACSVGEVVAGVESSFYEKRS